ncbi:MAG TPA: N-acetylmuramoyl-L-alanine amidase, partial [Gemmatimonadales bacterium]|nr:N-acetylmuramoyl-L-alanine amidase [Gemmatimonadales bacterium]
AFDRDPGNLQAATRQSRYVTTLRGRPIGPPPGAIFANGEGAAGVATGNGAPQDDYAELELIRGADTLRTRWPLQLAVLDTATRVVMLDDDPTRKGTTDSMTVGRAAPGGSYHWFFARGTRAVLERRQENDARLRLSRQGAAWVPIGDVVPLPPGTWPPLGRVGSITVSAEADRAVVRIPLGERVPVRVRDEERSLHLDLYASLGDVDWIRYPPRDSLVRRIDWTQAAADEVRIDILLEQPLWGYRPRWEGTDLVLDVRRPPAIDGDHPLRGRRILIDPGHPPLGATGPTGLREAEANLAVSLELRRLLLEAGAVVEMTREVDQPLDLWPRVDRADRSSAEILVSVHNNALPDGV